MSNEFQPLTIDALKYVTQSENLNHYADGLALIDDLLCGFDPERQPPMFLPTEAHRSGCEPGDIKVITPEMERCMNALQRGKLEENLRTNFDNAKALCDAVKDNPGASLENVRLFLSALLAQYAIVIHPSLAPNRED